MRKPGLIGFTEVFSLAEQYQILANLIALARDPQQRNQVLRRCRIPEAFFSQLLQGNFSQWSDDPVEPLKVPSVFVLDHLYDWFMAGFKVTPAELARSLERRNWAPTGLSLATISALWLWMEQTFTSDIPCLAPPHSPGESWRITVHPVPQRIVMGGKSREGLLFTIRDDATGHLIAYRFAPVTRSRDAWYHVLHDALALCQRTPTHLVFEQCLPMPFVQTLHRLHIDYQLNQPVTPYWQEWSKEQRATTWSAKQVYRLFGRYIECQQGYDPFRQLLDTYDVFDTVAADPARKNPDLRASLAESRTTIRDPEAVVVRGKTYTTHFGDPALPPPGTTIGIRLSAFSTTYGWVFVQGKLHTCIYQIDAPGDGAYIREFCDWE